MKTNELIELVKEIVEEATTLKNKHTDQHDALVNYACIFSQNNREYESLLAVTNKMGNLVKETPSGFLFHIHPIDTIAGRLSLLKIRKPDSTRPERGDADFTVSNYFIFKEKYLSYQGFKLILREDMEMIELVDPFFNVRTYFSHPPLDEQLGLKQLTSPN